MKEEKLKPGDYYLNEQGLMVLTAQYLLRRGYCCGNGCLHCPYLKDKKNINKVPKSSIDNIEGD